jgi:hypothetical protein
MGELYFRFNFVLCYLSIVSLSSQWEAEKTDAPVACICTQEFRAGEEA